MLGNCHDIGLCQHGVRCCLDGTGCARKDPLGVLEYEKVIRGAELDARAENTGKPTVFSYALLQTLHKAC